jgi:PAS domain S-box-containing protein
MPPPDRPDKRSSGNRLSLLALACMAAVISGLIFVDYHTQRSLQQANIHRFQQNLEDRGRSLAYFFSERENDVRALAGSTAITGFFANRALGMTMAYGLRASLNNIDRLFAERGENSRLGATSIYSMLFLLAEDGQLLSRWPADSGGDRQSSSRPPHSLGNTVVITDQGNGLISFTAPVIINERLQGYVQGWLHYQSLVDYLLRDLQGFLLITYGQQVVYRANTAPPVAEATLQALVTTSRSPLSLAVDQISPSDAQQKETTDAALFFTSVPGYDMRLLVIEDSSAANHQRHRFTFTAILVVLSVAAFGAAVLILRAGSRRLVLETSLVEANKREKALAEKKEELELVLAGARLGTWNWNLLDNQVEFNQRYWAMLGYDQEEAPGHFNAWKQLLHPDDAPQVIASLENHVAGRAPFYAAEYRMRHKNGTWTWVYDTGKIMQRDQRDTPVRAFGIHLDISERKESLRLLAKAKEESDAIIRDFLDTLIIVNTYLTVARVNQATCDLLGYEEDELIGRKISELFHDTPEHVHRIFAFYADSEQLDLQMREELRNVELCYRLKDGGRIPMSFNLSLLRTEEGAISGVVAGAKDISHLRQAMDKIAQQKEYIETLFNLIPNGLVALAPDQTVTTSNEAFKRLVADWAQRFAMDKNECGLWLIDKALQRQDEEEAFIVNLARGELHASFRCNLIFISVLEGVASVISIEDITEERKAEEERRLLATVIEQTADSVYITGTDDLVQYANPASIRNSGYSEQELRGQLPLVFRSELMEARTLEDLRRAMAEGRMWQGRFKTQRKDGSTMEEDATISPVRNADGEVTHFVGIKRDVSEIAHLQRQLLQAQKLEAIGQLAAGIAHEINTPMQYVQNNVTFFADSFEELRPLLLTLEDCDRSALPPSTTGELEALDLEFLLDEIPVSVQETLDGISRVVKIVAAMKEFSHPGGNEREAVDINHAIDSTLVVCRNEWKYVAEMETDFDKLLPLVPCFPDQLNQAVLNMVINAAHAIQTRKKTQAEPPGRITVTTRRDGDWAEIRITDNGSGIPEAIQQRIYDPFFTTKEVGKGTGQGLSIVHDIIINKHGGRISFDTEEGRGTTFIVRLPIRV